MPVGYAKEIMAKCEGLQTSFEQKKDELKGFVKENEPALKEQGEAVSKIKDQIVWITHNHRVAEVNHEGAEKAEAKMILQEQNVGEMAEMGVSSNANKAEPSGDSSTASPSSSASKKGPGSSSSNAGPGM